MQETVVELGWGHRVAVVHGRAEDMARSAFYRGRFDLVTARSFGPPAATAECAVGFLADRGTLAVTEPPGADGSRWPAKGLALLGLSPVGLTDGVQRLERSAALDDAYPRRSGVPVKRPLF